MSAPFATPASSSITCNAITLLSSVGLLDGILVNASGRAVNNDGGGGAFLFSASSSLSVDGGIVILPVSGSGRFIRVGYTSTGFKGDISPYFWAGDIRNASNDDVGILAALDFCAANNGGAIILPPGSVWTDTAEWKIPSYTALGCKAKPRAKIILSSQITRRQFSNRTVNTTDSTLTNPGIELFGIEVNGAAKNFPLWLSKTDGTSITNPQADYLPGGCLAPTTQATVTAAVSAGGVATYTVVTPGSGYVYPPSAWITGDGFFATATVNISGGQVTSVVAKSVGEGYTTASVVIAGGGADPSTALYAANRRNPGWSQGLDCAVFFKTDRTRIYDMKFTSYHATTITDQGSDGLWVYNCEFEDCGQTDFVGNCLWSQSHGTPTSPPVYYRQSTRTRFFNNKVKGQRRSVALLGGDHQWLYENDIDGWGESAVFVNNYATNPTVRDNKAKNGVYTDITCSFVESTAGGYVRVTGNEVEACEGPYVIMGGPGYNRTTGNVFKATAAVGRRALPFSPFSERVGYQAGTAAIANTLEQQKDSSFIVAKSQTSIIPVSWTAIDNEFICPSVNWIRDCIGVQRGPVNGMTGTVLIAENNMSSAPYSTLFNTTDMAAWIASPLQLRVLANPGHASAVESIVTRNVANLIVTSALGTAVDITTDGLALGASNFWSVPSDTLNVVRVTIRARQVGTLSGSGLAAVWRFDTQVQRGTALNSGGQSGGGSGLTPTFSIGTASTWRASAVVKTTSGNGQGGLLLTGTGDGSTNIVWSATIEPL